MVLLQEPFSEPDEYDIHLATRRKTLIPNKQGGKWNPGLLEIARVKYAKELPRANLQIIDSMYNCTGLVFAARRTTIDVGISRWLLEQDEYRHLAQNENPMVGDVVLYADESGELTHVGIVVEHKIAPHKKGEFETWVLSKWGIPGGEYIHPIDHVPADYGMPIEYWRHTNHK